MIAINCDGSLTTEAPLERVPNQAEHTIEVPVSLVVQQPDLLDRIFSAVFDDLGLQSVDIRVHPVAFDCQTGANCTIPCL